MKTSSVKGNTTALFTHSMGNYDVNGAMIYIFVVICWYSLGVAFMLGLQILARSTELEDLARRRTRFYMRNFRNQTNTKEILGEPGTIVSHSVRR
jgi:hypothetical protein